MQSLSLRKTHSYVGTYSYLDEWDDIGSFTSIASGTKVLDDEDPCDPIEMTSIIEIQTNEPEPLPRIVQALHSSLSSRGCHHEWDCCGCRSYSTGDIDHVRDNRFMVTVYSSRNY